MPNVNILRINGVDYTLPSGGGGGAVTSVNGKTGAVTLNASDVGALPSSTTIPSKTSDLTNDSDFVSDANYVHTDNNYTSTEKDKLAGVESGAEVNVQSDWEESDASSDAYIQHKPTIPTKTSDLTNDSNFITGLVVLTYGSSTWNDFITAFNANKIVYCRVPTGNDARYAFLAYYNGPEPSAEFQYYRSVRNHSQSAQGDEVYIYKLMGDGTWSTTTRKTYSNVNVSNGIKNSYYDYQLHLSIDSAYASFTNYYTKSNTYSKTEVDNIISGLTLISFEIVQTLPQTGETNIIYLVPKSPAQTDNTYDEYIYITDGGWEKIGDTEIDLSGYYKTSDTPETTLADDDYVPFYDDSATAKRKTKWSNIKAKLKAYFDGLYVGKVSGKGLSTNDYTTEEKDKLAGIESGAEVNQNAFSKVWVANTTIQANSKTDTLILQAGDNVTLTPDTNNDKVTISATDTTYSDATTDTHGLMSSSDKRKLDGIQREASKVAWTQNLTAGNLSGVLTINGTDYPVYYERYTAESPWVEYEMPYLNNPEDRYEGVYRFRATSENIHTTNTVEIFSNAPKAVYDSVLIEEGQITVTYRTNQIARTNVVKARVS